MENVSHVHMANIVYSPMSHALNANKKHIAMEIGQWYQERTIEELTHFLTFLLNVFKRMHA